jgi:molybdopterin-dependent oxidoreductase alpha subunit
MAARRPVSGGGFRAIAYTINKAQEVGPLRLWRRVTAKNACKTCALGMGGQRGGMVNEKGHFPEICKKSLQAQVADMKGVIPPDFFGKNSLEELQKLTPKQAEDCGRLVYPIMYRADSTGGKFQRISWAQAMEHLAGELKQVEPSRAAFYSSGRSSNEAGFLLQSFARIYGTNNVMNCSYYCHQASGVGLKMTFGSATSTIELDDIAKSDLVVLLGANPASNHPRLMTQLANLRGRGGAVIVVNPVRESGLENFHVPSQLRSLLFGSEIASLYIQPLAGGDAALLIGVLKSLADHGQLNKQFLAQYTDGWEQVIADAQAMNWDELVENSGVERAQIEQMANMIAGSKAAVFAWAMGLTHHKSGVENILSLSNVALSTGNVGKPGAGMLPIRGHSNVQGIGSVGVTPALQDAVRQSLEKLYGKLFPTANGYDTHASLEAAEQGKLDMLVALGGNLWGSNPDLAWASKAMGQIKTIVYLSTKLNPGHFHGIAGETTIILPVLARDEEPQSTTQESMFNFVRLSEGGTPNVRGQMRAESEVICDLANRVLGDIPVDWNRLRDHAEVRKLIAEAIPGWEEIGNIDRTRHEFTINGRVFHTPHFATNGGRAVMHRTSLPKFEHDALRLITLRSEGQFNTVVYEENDLYRGIPHRYCILLASEDAHKLNIQDGERVSVRGEAGEMDNIEVVIGNIRAGNAAMYYPEANVLIKANLDPRSKTPSFKSAPIWITKSTTPKMKPAVSALQRS